MNNNSLSEQLDNINLNQLNIIKLSNAYLEATTTNKKHIDVELEMTNEETRVVLVPPNIALGNDLKRMSATINN